MAGRASTAQSGDKTNPRKKTKSDAAKVGRATHQAITLFDALCWCGWVAPSERLVLFFIPIFKAMWCGINVLLLLPAHRSIIQYA